ncbi:SDR family NAD(P)-dependent oxidoreductase [Kineococcus aurantiacus]|uniref:NAD(P)-dependent dehydrogenase (Short-subunit alcohol dehydrogenase family) n=1 Tax=Kineococcus aurantiacus TaxID=37633 RepID=A0A7Y9DQC7_9ACTN|nr:SDR family NAD(P)-dependent oxidoreductase [Kineococcus aurantiacus]NYD24880.1 NAD(P)-dependent dehydrogenase (short-subunit alcohol dehydrogenase family) [Kineococcus aurantiacus]
MSQPAHASPHTTTDDTTIGEPALHGRAAIVTGAGSGLGRATALALRAAGADVLAVDVDGDAARRTAAQSPDTAGAGRADAFAADVTDPAQVDAYVARVQEVFGTPTLFFNNAGVEGAHTTLADTTLESWFSVVNVNLHGVFLGLRAVLPVMAAAGGGAIVNTGSLLSLKGAPARADYVATKHAVLGLTRVAAAEGAAAGVRVNCICPGPVDTPLMSRSEHLVNPDDPQFERRRFIAGTPLGRYGTPQEIAHLVRFLLSPGVDYLTGAAVSVDGGITAV